MDLKTLKKLFNIHKEKHLSGRYIFSDHIVPLIEKLSDDFKTTVIGQSVLGEDIYAIRIGNGKTKILMWSQMHGNESTTTKAIFDLCNVLANSTDKKVQTILETCSIAIIPMLNPDGAQAYTRINANEIDLNRDAKDLTQPESKALRTYFDTYKPDFCFNLHGQRTIFSAGYTNYPATISFLAPAQDAACTVTQTRMKAMEVIVKMNKNLQNQIPNQVGIYDDAFNINCVGDTFQSLNVPTILFEAGHYKYDYNREVIREYIFQSLVVAIDEIARHKIDGYSHRAYFDIPQNRKLFYDIIIRNAKVTLDYKSQILDVAIQYQETLDGKKIQFVPKIEKISSLKDFYGHKEINANAHEVLCANKDDIFEGYENDFVLLNNEEYSLKPENN